MMERRSRRLQAQKKLSRLLNFQFRHSEETARCVETLTHCAQMQAPPDGVDVEALWAHEAWRRKVASTKGGKGRGN